MRFSLNLGNGGPCADPRTMADLARLAEESGWDGVFLEDYIVYQNQTGTPTYDPWVCLAAMAMRTQRVRLGTTVTPLPRRRVAKLAAETVALDHLSGGRLTLGVGLGDAWDVALANLGEQTPLSGARRHPADQTGTDTTHRHLDRRAVPEAGSSATRRALGRVVSLHPDELLSQWHQPA